MAGFADNLRRGKSLFDVVLSIIQEAVDPNTTDNWDECRESIERAFIRLGFPRYSSSAAYITDMVMAAGGGLGAEQKVLADLDAYFVKSGDPGTPQLVLDLVQPLLSETEKDIRAWRAGKPIVSS